MGNNPIAVLMIEDTVGVSKLITSELKDCEAFRFEVEQTQTLQAGLERLAKSGIDVVVLDLGLPDSTGYSTFEKVTQQFPGLPIVIISGLSDEKIALEAVKNGAQDYLLKGKMDLTQLPRILCYAVERSRQKH